MIEIPSKTDLYKVIYLQNNKETALLHRLSWRSLQQLEVLYINDETELDISDEEIYDNELLDIDWSIQNKTNI